MAAEDGPPLVDHRDVGGSEVDAWGYYGDKKVARCQHHDCGNPIVPMEDAVLLGDPLGEGRAVLVHRKCHNPDPGENRQLGEFRESNHG